MFPAPKRVLARTGWRPATAASSSAPSPARPLAESLQSEGSLAGLLARVRDSEARLQELRGILPADLLARLRAGPLDDDGWTILAANSAVAAKLRHLVPIITETLQDRGWATMTVRVKVHVPE